MSERRPESESESNETGTGWPEPVGPAESAGPPDPRPDAPPADGVGPLVTGPGGGTPAGTRPAADPAPGAGRDGADGDDASPDGQADAGVDADAAVDGAGSRGRLRRPSAAGGIIVLLLGLLGFALAVQLRSNSTDQTLASARQEDLVRILSDLEAQQQRLRQDIAGLEDSQQQLASGAQGRQAALEEATRRADELGILAGTLPARGPGLTVRFSPGSKPIGAATVLDAVQELRGAGAEAMEISGGDGATVRIIASTYFLDADGGGITVGGRRLTGPFTLTVVGEPDTMRTALNIAGGVVASVAGDGGNVIVDEHAVVDVRALSPASELKYAHPVS
ncbi:DUF881 domain-containing protein [Plantactinospora sp. KBS50]|uniref:DUF881 domain-containing protein n=1 Tax=Plantactinospora sp. KBS50 TaxID=2024580 RepID=UPI000BAB162B|nr:DUF881 domain-containing protein [Plantactinospora sp. KBS50]ASW55119.1 hypothetical protein CIK06_14465 [Plantactinospora sp. KBS50]